MAMRGRNQILGLVALLSLGACTGKKLPPLDAIVLQPTPTPLPQILLARNGPNDVFSQVYGINSNGTGLAELSTGDWLLYRWPAWMPQKAGFVYSALLGGVVSGNSILGGAYDIFIQSDLESVVNLTNHPADDTYPSPSPDGTRIAFTSNRSGQDELFLLDLFDGGRLAQLTSLGGLAPTWSSDNSQICFSRYSANAYLGVFQSLYVLTVGSGLETLIANVGEDPAWSPAGNTIAYSMNGNIWTINSDGTNAIQVTASGQNSRQPTWSPDGTKIIFQSSQSGDWDLYQIKPDGTNLSSISISPGSEEQEASWQY